MTIAQLLNTAERKLANSASPRLDAEVLLAHVLKVPRSTLLAQIKTDLSLCHFSIRADRKMTRKFIGPRTLAKLRFKWLAWQRKRGVPVAYLTHHKEFYGRSFFMNKSVLIPRPETEVLTECVIRSIRANRAITRAVDVGTGSGCIAVTLACELPHLKVVATDISKAALRVAQKNSAHHGVADRITFLHGNLLEPLIATGNPVEARGPRGFTSSPLANSLRIANLPYLLSEEITQPSTLMSFPRKRESRKNTYRTVLDSPSGRGMTNDLRFEPQTALVGGSDGLKFYRELAEQLLALPSNNRPRAILLELHPPTALEVQKIFSPLGTCEIINDTASLPRVLTITTA